jgi:uncharacterized membrane protein
VKETSSRIVSLDVMRGVAMVLMALDHVRDYYAPTLFAVEDLSRTTPALFLTRWITHIGAPIFVLLVGTSAHLYRSRHQLGRGELARFLLVRGLWLIVLEFTIMHFVWWLGPDPGWLASPYAILYGQILWTIGLSMVVLAGLVYLPAAVVGAIGALTIVGHHLLERWSFELGILTTYPVDLTVAQKLWAVLHVPTRFPWLGDHWFGVVYPLVPWVGVVALGYGLGPLFRLEPERRRRILLWLGLGLCAAFVVLRGTNVYGDPYPWTVQKSPLFTAFSFGNVEKYPVSLSFLLMTLGPIFVLLALLDRARGPVARFLAVLGSVPLFYYVVHLALINATAGLYFYLRWGQPRWGAMMYAAYPLGYVYNLPVVYAVATGVVLVMVPLCRWYAGVKRKSDVWWLSYL